MTDSNYTAIQVVMDHSGSMINIAHDMEGALATFIADQIKEPGIATIRLSQFDTDYEVVYGSSDLSAVPPYRLKPRGGTALNDAIGRAIGEFGRELSDLSEDKRPANVLFVIITDGEENSSKEYDHVAIKSLVTAQQKQWNWKFLFLAANQDAVLTGSKYGFNRGQTMTYNASSAGTYAAGQTLSSYATTTRSGLVPEVTEEERAEASK
jgi:uncharacterized protein YegL